MDQKGPQMDPEGLKIVFLYQQCLFCGNFIGTTLSEEIILDNVSLGGSPTISATLNGDKYSNFILIIANNTLIKSTAFMICKL